MKPQCPCTHARTHACTARRRSVPYRLHRRGQGAASTSAAAQQQSQQQQGRAGGSLPPPLLSIAAISRKGYAPGYKEDNQDRCLVVQVRRCGGTGRGRRRKTETAKRSPPLPMLARPQPYLSEEQTLFGVMDGHGAQGHHVSEFIKSRCVQGRCLLRRGLQARGQQARAGVQQDCCALLQIHAQWAMWLPS